MTNELTLKVGYLKSKEGNEYLALFFDLGYTRKVVSVDRAMIAELLDISVRELYRVVPEHGMLEFSAIFVSTFTPHD